MLCTPKEGKTHVAQPKEGQKRVANGGLPPPPLSQLTTSLILPLKGGGHTQGFLHVAGPLWDVALFTPALKILDRLPAPMSQPPSCSR